MLHKSNAGSSFTFIAMEEPENRNENLQQIDTKRLTRDAHHLAIKTTVDLW